MRQIDLAQSLLLLLLAVPACFAQSRILVYNRSYTPDGKGYVHDNIAASAAAIQRIGSKNGIVVDVSDSPAMFTRDNLKRYSVIVFSNSNNEAFTSDDQRNAFKAYIEHGGGFVGVHSASGSERKWDWFAQMVGARFVIHPKYQHFQVHVAEPNFTAVAGLPADFTVEDECYFFKTFADDLHVVLTTDRTKLDLMGFKANASDFPNPLPLAWWHEFDGGREFYLALGHDKLNYSDPMFTGILERAILWAGKRQ